MAGSTKSELCEYVEGSIIRIKLENFLTYDTIEIKPGPHLNVIIGPNGTGKSSIVCAIALGLAAKTSVLGRAKEVQDFVKHGCVKGIVELELYNKSGQNWVIKREIHKKESKEKCSKWSVNNRPATMKSVEEMVGRLNVQVGNLCQFLPQDKVADFAKMNQQDLLENTEKAVGGQDMYDNHQKLKTARERGRELELNYTRTKEHLEQERSKNSRLEQDVKNFRERQKYLENIKTLQMKKPWVEYEDKRKQYIDEKEKKEKLEKEMAEVVKQNAPLRKKLDQAKKQVTDCDQKKKKKDEDIRSQAKLTASKSKLIEELTEQLDDCGQELENKRKDEEKRQKKLNELREHVKSLEEELSNVDVQDVQPELDRVSGEMRNLNREMSQVVQACESARGQQNVVSREVTAIQTELRRLQDVSNQRLDLLRRRNKDAYSAVMWLRSNQDKFKHSIHEPMMTVINVNNTAHAKYIESHISVKDMYAFVCDDKEDLEKFMVELRDGQDLRVSAVEMPSRSSAQFKPNKPIEEYKRHGFYSYLREMFTCPEAVMRYLCQQYAVHSVPVGNKHTKDRVEEVIKNNPELRLFYTENHRYSVKMSKYSGATSTSSSEVHSMSLLTMAVDRIAEQQLNTDLQVKQSELEATDREYSSLQRQRQDQERQMNVLRNKKKELQERKNVERNLKNKINMKEDSIKRLESECYDLEKEEATAKSKMKSIAVKKIKLLREMKDNIKKCINLSKEKAMLSIEHTDSMRSLIMLEAQLRDDSQNLQQIEKEFADAKERMRKTKDYARRMLETAKNVTNTKSNEDLSEELKNAFMSCPNTVEEIDTAIHEGQARADCTLQTDESVVEDYQRRKFEIGRLEKQSDQQKAELDGHQDEIDRTKARWLEPLKELLGRINEQFGHFFAQLKCAGEVDLNVPENPEDYERYGVKIMVKFRASESLRELTSHYQSGGEKSVATVLYMMSLQELTQCPFRCVDEINQGMDPNNERKVFELVVKTACREGTSQYFLLTPKLLPDLAYGERMTVICIFNGPYMVHHKDWNIKKFLKRRAKLED